MGARSAAASVVRHVGGVAAEATLVAALVATVALAFSPVYAPATFIAGTESAFAAKGGNHSDPPCTISASTVAVGETYVVSVSGLPTGTAINLWVTDTTGTVGRPLGGTPDGTFALQEQSSIAGTTTYTFTGPTKKNMAVYGSCSVDAY